MKTIFFAMPNGKFDGIFPSPVLDEMRTRYRIIDAPVPDTADSEFVSRHIAEANVLVTSWGTPQLDGDILTEAERLELVVHAAGSIRPVVSETFWERGVTITSCARAIADGVAEFCLGLTITCSKRAFWYALQVREGAWPKGNHVFGPPFEIYRQDVGIVGAGYVGRKFISLLKPFGCNILLYDPYVTAGEAADLGVEKADTLEELFGRSRVVSLHAPTTEETRGMIRGRHFALLPEGALFINTARGAIIRQDEMIEELRRGRFVACLDVTDPEPPLLDDPLRSLPNVLVTPHEAGTVFENLRRIGELALSQIDDFYAGRTPAGSVTRKQLERMA